MPESNSNLSPSGTAFSVPEMAADSSKRGSESQRHTQNSRKSWELDSLLKDAGAEPEEDLVPKWKKVCN